MTLVIAWVLFPLVLGLLSLGCGLVVERASGLKLPGILLPGIGLAAIVVVAGFATLSDTTAELATPAVIALAMVGFGLSYPWRGRPIDWWGVAAAVGVFAAFAAPTVLSGDATFAGYIKIDDTSTWFAITDRVMDHGRSLEGLGASSYEGRLDLYIGHGYPIGVFLPLGIGRALVGQDVAWLFQPYIAFLAAMLGLALYALIEALIRSPWARALAVFVAGQPALLYGYGLWGGAKEVMAAWALAIFAALAPLVLRGPDEAGVVVPLALVGAAALCALSALGMLLLAPLLVGVLVAVLLLRGSGFALRRAIEFSGFFLALSLPAFATLSGFLDPASGTLTKGSEVANLMHPLDWLQLFGIWPVGDFRSTPGELGVTHALIALLVAAALVGLVWAWIRQAWNVLLYVGGAVLACVAVAIPGSPWIDAKGLAISSPALVLAGLVGAAALFERIRIAAPLIAAAIAAGVLWSNAFAYHDVNLAPRDRLVELQRIGNRIKSEGPTLLTENEPYGYRHFLRDARPDGDTIDLDQVPIEQVLSYRTLVVRRSPQVSRPPSNYRPIWEGRYYEAWQRPAAQQTVVAHLPVGGTGRPNCRNVLRLAAVARKPSRFVKSKLPAGVVGRLAVAPAPQTTIVRLSQSSHPASWRTGAKNPDVVLPTKPGTANAPVRLSASGHYRVWLRGPFRPRLELSIDGKAVEVTRHKLDNAGQYLPAGEVSLRAGVHRVTLEYGKADLHPGSGGRPFPLGPVVLSSETPVQSVEYLPPSKARSLCRRNLDWVEVVVG